MTHAQTLKTNKNEITHSHIEKAKQQNNDTFTR